MRKVRTVIYLDRKESESLKNLSKRTGAKITELARRAIAEYLKRRTSDRNRLYTVRRQFPRRA